MAKYTVRVEFNKGTHKAEGTSVKDVLLKVLKPDFVKAKAVITFQKNSGKPFSTALLPKTTKRLLANETFRLIFDKRITKMLG